MDNKNHNKSNKKQQLFIAVLLQQRVSALQTFPKLTKNIKARSLHSSMSIQTPSSYSLYCYVRYT